MSNLPLGAEYNSSAPWNDKDRTVKVFVSLTISKTLEITVPESKFYVEKDEDGSYIECSDLTVSDLVDIVREQHVLPHEGLDWNEDDIELIYEG